MNQARIWLVVKPTVGLPLFLGAVASTSLLVHYAILTHTSWYPAFWQGGKSRAAQAAPDSGQSKAASLAPLSATAKVLFDKDATMPGKATLVFPDGRTASVVFEGSGPPATGEVRAVLEDGKAAPAALDGTGAQTHVATVTLDARPTSGK